jgi:hypothetical protein
MPTSLEGISKKLAQANDLLASKGIRPSELVGPDAFCYRVETIRRYDEMKQYLGSRAVLLDESEVAGRLIAVYEITGIPQLDGLDGRQYLELPQPKPDNQYSEGIEHVQYVTDMPLDRFLRCHSDIDWRVTGPPHNRLAAIRGKDINVKFHDRSLGEVIETEKSLSGRAK